MQWKCKKLLLYCITALLVYIISACYITYPLIFHLGDYATGLVDELLIAWIHAWVVHTIFSNPLALFNANIYYPYPNTLAYSDLFLTSSILTYPFVLIIGQPIAANNILYISSLMLLGFSLFLLAFYLTNDFLASLLGGILVIFSSATLSNYVGLQILSIASVPLAILFFLIFLHKNKTKYLIFSLIFFLLQTYNSFLPGFFILFSYLISILYKFFDNKKKTITVFTKKNITIIAVAFLLIIPVVIPYYQVSREFHYVRDLRDTIHFALQPEDLLYSSNFSHLGYLLNNLSINKNSQNSEFKPGYLGLVFSFLVIWVIYFFIKKRKLLTVYEKIFLTISLLGLLLSLGPFLHLGRHTIHKPFPIPLPYLLFYYLVPGFNGIRNSARWEMLFIIGMATTTSLVLSQSLKKIIIKIKTIIYLLLFFGVLLEFNHGIPYVKVPQKNDFPKVYSWMNTTSVNSVFIQMPAYTWNMLPYVFEENLREYESTVGFRRMVNGASGYSPQPWLQIIVSLMENFPSDRSIMLLKNIGVNYIIVYKKEYDTLNKSHMELNRIKIKNGSSILNSLFHYKNVHFVKRFDDDYVFKIS